VSLFDKLSKDEVYDLSLDIAVQMLQQCKGLDGLDLRDSWLRATKGNRPSGIWYENEGSLQARALRKWCEDQRST
jgi:hypothetical protein